MTLRGYKNKNRKRKPNTIKFACPFCLNPSEFCMHGDHYWKEMPQSLRVTAHGTCTNKLKKKNRFQWHAILRLSTGKFRTISVEDSICLHCFSVFRRQILKNKNNKHYNYWIFFIYKRRPSSCGNINDNNTTTMHTGLHIEFSRNNMKCS